MESVENTNPHTLIDCDLICAARIRVGPVYSLAAVKDALCPSQFTIKRHDCALLIVTIPSFSTPRRVDFVLGAICARTGSGG